MIGRSSKSKGLPLRVVHKVPALDRALAPWRTRNDRVALVPTMGALHAGHLALVRLAKRHADRVVVSIFVNPTQFAPTEDLSSYPRRLTKDISQLAAVKTDLVWAPSVQTMYPKGFATRIVPEGPATVGLEDAFRPHFFAGVATVVAKLLIQCRPDFAIFGEKDYQQLKVVTQLARDLDLGTRIVAAPTVREKDGLALSSRNLYLSPHERAVAPVLHRVLAECAKKIAGGRPLGGVLEQGRTEITKTGFALDYLEARDAETLAPVTKNNKNALRLLVAARLRRTRLIDNVAV